MLILDLWGVSFHAAVVFGLGKDFLFEFIIVALLAYRVAFASGLFSL